MFTDSPLPMAVDQAQAAEDTAPLIRRTRRRTEEAITNNRGQVAVAEPAYMCHLDKFGLVRTAETMSKSFSVEFKKHSDAKNYIERERLGLLHLRIFDVWVQEVKKVIMENNAHSANCL